MARLLGAKAPAVQRKLMSLGTMVSINQEIDLETATQVAKEFDYQVEDVGFREEQYLEVPAATDESEAATEPRPPVITVMGGNAGSQAAITMVRRLALHQVRPVEIGSIVFREARIGMLLGFLSGIIVGGTAFLWRGEWFYGVVVGVAMMAAILVAATMGPWYPSSSIGSTWIPPSPPARS